VKDKSMTIEAATEKLSQSQLFRNAAAKFKAALYSKNQPEPVQADPAIEEANDQRIAYLVAGCLIQPKWLSAAAERIFFSKIGLTRRQFVGLPNRMRKMAAVIRGVEESPWLAQDQIAMQKLPLTLDFYALELQKKAEMLAPTVQSRQAKFKLATPGIYDFSIHVSGLTARPANFFDNEVAELLTAAATILDPEAKAIGPQDIVKARHEYKRSGFAIESTGTDLPRPGEPQL
jgi:hypothetical protein